LIANVTVFRELGLTPFPAIDLDGCLSELARPLAGQTVADARSLVIEML